MKQLLILVILLFFSGCSQKPDKEEVKKEIYSTEKAFEKMTHEKGIAEAFYFYADENAVIKRQNDTLIIGKDNIRNFYGKDNYKLAEVNWTPDFIEVSESGDIAYTYGKYVWRIWKEKSDTTEFRGIFHTVWKRQQDKSWKYVWD